MKKMILGTLVFLMSSVSLAGGSRFSCRSTDGKIYLNGHGADDAVTVQSISDYKLKNKSGKDLGVLNGSIVSQEMQGEGLPEFGDPQSATPARQVKVIVDEIKQKLAQERNEVTEESRLVALSDMKLLAKNVEDVGREIGEFVFTQSLAVIHVVHTPKHKNQDGTYFRVSIETKAFACESSYATTCGGRCN